MKKLWLCFFLLSPAIQAKFLEVPENCFAERVSPCLIKMQSQDESLIYNSMDLRILKDSMIVWNTFAEEFSITLLKGSFQVKKSEHNFKLNEVPFSLKSALIKRKDKVLSVLDLSTFLLSNYNLSDIQQNSVLARSTFLEKLDLLDYSAGFFNTRSDFQSFTKSIEVSWKTQFKQQTENQTKVLKRAIASTAQAERQLESLKARQDRELKKVRDEFFYRTFFR